MTLEETTMLKGNIINYTNNQWTNTIKSGNKIDLLWDDKNLKRRKRNDVIGI